MALSITAIPSAGNVPPRVALTVDTTGYVGYTLQIFRVDGSSQVLVRDSETTPDIGDVTWLGFDYEAPFEATVTYQVVVYDGANALASASSASTSLDVTAAWLIHPGDPDLSIPVEVKKFGERRRSIDQSTQRVIGRSDPVVTTDTRGTVETSIEIATSTIAEADAVHALLADGQTILVNVPPSWNWGVTTEWAACGQTVEARVVDVGSRQHRVITVPYVVVSRPEGDLAPLRTYADVLTEASTYAQALAQRATYADLLVGS